MIIKSVISSKIFYWSFIFFLFIKLIVKDKSMMNISNNSRKILLDLPKY